MISFIVSVYGETLALDACIACLKTQDGENEIIVCDNNPGFLELSQRSYGMRVATGAAGCKNCYESANLVAPMARGDWLCFPSDDSLYVQGFSRIMLETAERTGADLVYCDVVYKCGTEVNSWKSYSLLRSLPRMGSIDKTNFIVRRELFKGFPEHPRQWRDGALIEKLIRDGARPAKAPGILVVHQ